MFFVVMCRFHFFPDAVYLMFLFGNADSNFCADTNTDSSL